MDELPIASLSGNVLLYLLFYGDNFIVDIVLLKTLCSNSYKSLKYSCYKAYSAVIRLSGS